MDSEPFANHGPSLPGVMRARPHCGQCGMIIHKQGRDCNAQKGFFELSNAATTASPLFDLGRMYATPGRSKL